MEDIEKKLFMYSLYSKDTETYSIIVMGYDDKATIDYYVNEFKKIYNSLSDYYKGEKLESELNAFVDKVHSSCIYKVAYFDEFKGEFINDKNLLVDLFDLNLLENESEEKINVKTNY